MTTHQRALGIAAITAIAAILGFITPDASGTRNVWLPVVKRTECSVLVGSLAELDAMKMSGEIIARLRRRSAK